MSVFIQAILFVVFFIFSYYMDKVAHPLEKVKLASQKYFG